LSSRAIIYNKERKSRICENESLFAFLLNKVSNKLEFKKILVETKQTEKEYFVYLLQIISVKIVMLPIGKTLALWYNI